MPRLLLRRTIALGIVAAISACGRDESSSARTARNLILISIDTLRADRLGFMGYERDTSPRLDELAARGAVFRNAVTESGWTLPAHVTMLSGLAPASHGVTKPAFRIRADTPLLAETLRAAGFETIALTGGVFVSRRHGFERGFDVFDDEDRGLAAALAAARPLLDGLGRDERFFLFLHTYDVHCPYEPRDLGESVARLFTSPDAEFIETAGRCGNPDFNSIPLSSGQVRHLSDRYDASIREADTDLGAFVAWLETRGLMADTLVVVTSDHGESFSEHGQIGHERSVYREVIDVPLVFIGPGVASARVDAAVSLADVVPTVLELLGLPAGGATDGRSLAEPLGSGDFTALARERLQFSEVSWQANLRSLATESHHLVLDLETGRVELFAGDALDDEDVSAVERTRTAELEARLRAHIAAHPIQSAPTIEPLTPEQEEELRDLGYL